MVRKNRNSFAGLPVIWFARLLILLFIIYGLLTVDYGLAYAGQLLFDGVPVDITTSTGEDLVIVPGSGGNTQIGDATGTNSHATSNDDLHITGILEVDGNAYFDSATTFASSFSPSADSTSDLGSSTLAWRYIYVDTISGYNAALALNPASGYSLTGSVIKSASTGDEAAYDLAATINKATSGNYTGLKLNVTETSAPGTTDKLLDLQVGGTSCLQAYNGANSANYGLLSIGTDDWDGSTTGFFAGSANGTQLAINAITGFTGNLVDAQVAGSSKFSVDANGNVTAAGTITGAAGGYAPTNAQYVTLATNATLTAERVLTGTSNQITVTDGGAGTTVTLSTPQNIDTTATPQFARLGLGAAADATNILTTTSSSTAANSKVANITHTGEITGTGYAGYFSKTGTSTTNVGLYATASGATNNYAAIFDSGNVGIGDTTPDAVLDIDSSGTTGNIFGITSTTLTTGEAVDITATFAPADGSTQEGIDLNFTHTPTASADTFRGIDLALSEGANALANTLYGVYVTTDNSANTSTGTHSVYGGYFATTGKAAGTTTAYGIYATASGADTNYPGYFTGGPVMITDGTHTINTATGNGDLFVDGNLEVDGTLNLGSTTVSDIKSNSDIYLNYDGADGNSYLYFYEGNSTTGASIYWDNSGNGGAGNFTIDKDIWLSQGLSFWYEKYIYVDWSTNNSIRLCEANAADSKNMEFRAIDAFEWINTDAAAYNGTSMVLNDSGNLGVNDTVPDAKLDVLNTGSGASFRVDDSSDGDTTPFIIDADGNVGIGTTAPAHKLDVSGAIYSRRNALTDGATITVDWNNGNVQSVSLGGNRAIEFSNGQDGGKYILILKQDATGSRTVTWAPTGGNIRWSGATAPTLTTTASKTDYIGFIYNGVDSKYDGVAHRLNF